MPPPRKSSPRRRERRSRSRSRSHSPRHRRRSRSHSRSPRDRRRSRSPQRRRSPERKHRSPPRRRSPSPRRRSRSPKRRSRSHSPRRRSRSKSPRRKAPSPRRRSPSPDDRNHPVKRPADSSVKRQSYRSRSPSPKRSRDERLYQDESPYEQQRSTKHSRSPVHESPYGGKMYADQSSSSKQPLFPAGSSKRTPEIDFVTIVEKGPKKQKLNKRFETLEQVAQGAFDFEENITIGIHRGPQHIELDDDEDVEVNYEFNPKTFKMLFPKKNYVKAIFDRDEIKAFHHDDILDEEAYVEKRTISIKPVDKPKSRKHDDELDYRITVGAGREGYGDRRMVHDSGSRSRPSRSSGYDDIPVTVRLDPKPDPRYEKIYRDQQRYEDQSLMQEKVHRNPNDLRYNLMRRKSEGDSDRRRDARDSHGGPSGMMDARTRIEARRQEGHRDDYPDRRDRPGDRRASRGTPPRSIERKKAPIKTDLPDFKNRPDDLELPPDDALKYGKRSAWGHCSVCNVPLNSEKQAIEHVSGDLHRSNEDLQRVQSSPSRQNVDYANHNRGSHSRAGTSEWSNTGQRTGDSVQRLRSDDLLERKRHRSTDSDFDHKEVKRRSITDDFEQVSDNEGNDYPGPEYFDGAGDLDDSLSNWHDNRGPPSRSTGKSRSEHSGRRSVWIIGTDEMKALQQYSADSANYGSDFGLGHHNISVVWNCTRGLCLRDVLPTLAKMKIEETKPDCIVLHVGVNDLEKLSRLNFKGVAMDMIDGILEQFPGVKLAWSELLPKSRGVNSVRVAVNDEIATYILEGNGHYIHYPALDLMDRNVFKMSKNGEFEITVEGIIKMMPVLKGGLVSILNRNISIVPVLSNLPKNVSFFVNKNMGKKFYSRKKTFRKPYYFKKKFPFSRR
ncbi:serine/arginine repetitive matrix protein 1-like isoform X3 [Mercenaria mercenaria]|uniref:serine/arginine repetitive matrix protein 1-like isoform X3 n=1 Tax=Mercenaria mercenaria TaxID=6596 RepID=UPI00234FA905|nr:serine/arginine repetitive matrix protein 1-like isoform X3 [Mercenaria mercenaria]